ncbi:MAG: phosphatidate cytidylyltransferase [Candidatus Obscuribacter sp.]|nr:phosphatidate cytidylyltransferase [Candidatus Melainabacteria bacterium]MDX1985426.1 phosphatidate cytidylyltransferase [Candidatus Obscuribacter sp.]
MRLLFGWLLFFLAVASIMAGGKFLALVLGAACFMGGKEFIAMAKRKGINPSSRIVLSMIVAFFVVAAIPDFIPGRGLNLGPLADLAFLKKLAGSVDQAYWSNFSINHFPLLLTIGIYLSFFRLLFRNVDPPATIADIASTILGFIYVGWLPSHLVILRNLSPEGMPISDNPLQQPGLAYVWATLFIIWATDVFAYYFGKKYGKHLLYPQISPKKTVEGAIGGLLAAVALGLVVIYVADHHIFECHPFRFNLWQAPLMAIVISVAAQLGDLCESLLKRDAGLKDSSDFIPGHGGFLDRGDSLIIGSAVAYYWVCLVVLNQF